MQNENEKHQFLQQYIFKDKTVKSDVAQSVQGNNNKLTYDFFIAFFNVLVDKFNVRKKIIVIPQIQRGFL